MSESKMAKFNRVDFKMAAIIRLSQNEWQTFFLFKMAESKTVEFLMAAIIKMSQNEWVKFFMQGVWNPRWQYLRWLPSSSWVRINEWSFCFVGNGWLEEGRSHDGWHHQVKWEWMSLCQIELVGTRVLCKMAESKMASFMMAEYKDGCHHQVESEWMSQVFFCSKWLTRRRQNLRWLTIIKLEWEWMSLSQIELVWVRVLCKMAESKIGEFTMDPSSSWVRMNEWSFFLFKMAD